MLRTINQESSWNMGTVFILVSRFIYYHVFQNTRRPLTSSFPYWAHSESCVLHSRAHNKRSLTTQKKKRVLSQRKHCHCEMRKRFTNKTLGRKPRPVMSQAFPGPHTTWSKLTKWRLRENFRSVVNAEVMTQKSHVEWLRISWLQ